MDNYILNGLNEYNMSGSYPWHMPGHKRKTNDTFLELEWSPFSIDVTEVEGLDELHNPSGIIKDAMNRIKEIYGTDQSYFLVNGSTSGILSAISAVCSIGDTIIMARNCHSSVYHAVRLLQLKPVYVMPDWNEKLSMFGGVSPDRIKHALKSNPFAKAVIITSPTYEGVVSDVERIAKYTHKGKIPLIVDEAHGAHFEFVSNVNETISSTNYKNVPSPAIRLGADLVIESLHKTLPAMTQCAIIHRMGNLVDKSRLEEFLSIYQTTSPSYVFMATMESCIEKMDFERDGAFLLYKQILSEYRKKFATLSHIHLVELGDFKNHNAFAYDDGKLVFSVEDCGIVAQDGTEVIPFTGVMLGQMLREDYGQSMEMQAENYIIAMTSVVDQRESFEALYQALESIDQQLMVLSEYSDIEDRKCLRYNRIPDQKMSISEAKDSHYSEISLSEASGKPSAEYIYIYPPGIPFVTPGEVVTKEIIEELLGAIGDGLNVRGIQYNKDETDEERIKKSAKIRVVRDNRRLYRKLFH